jgi:hypothetical protein
MGTVDELRSLFQTHEECRLELGHFPGAVITRLEKIEGVLDLELSKNGDERSILNMKIINREAVLPRLLRLVMESGAQVYNCQLKPLPLEELFAHALGHGAEEKR